MTDLERRLRGLDRARLQGIRRGIEKESLRAQAGGRLALTPHPAALGSALTHPNITTDFSESQLELVTGVHASATACLDELTQVHRFVHQEIGDELLWAGSMPCELPGDASIPIARYGASNIGRAKSVYREGLSHRYGRRMQTISGLHYNWSMPGLSSDDYFGLIRNFRRHAFLLLVLFGASPAVCASFVAGLEHRLRPLGDDTLHLPDATSLRMGRLGYQSDAQATLAVSYNGLDSYGASLHDALTRPYPAYEALGLRDADGGYRQLATTLLQIENEFYGTIRPKRVIRSGERPLHALRERGVEYVEVRCMDLDPFSPVGIEAATLRMLDVFLLHCLLSDSPPDTPAEIAAVARNQHLVAERGRDPLLRLERGEQSLPVAEWGAQILDECAPVARALDAADANGAHAAALASATQALREPGRLPSARVLAAMREAHGGSHLRFVEACSLRARDALRQPPLPADQRLRFERLARESLQEQQGIEAAQTMAFEAFRQHYVSPQRLSP